MSRLRLLALAAAALSACAAPFPEGVTGEVVTEDARPGVPCLLRLWRGSIGPLDGRGEAIALASVQSGAPFEVALRPTGARAAAEGRFWLTVECDGYFIKVRGVEWSGARRLLPALEIGQVWVPKRKS